MADPTIQTFCCLQNNSTTKAVDELLGFSSMAYNVVCIISSLIGIGGAVYQILPRETNNSARRQPTHSAKRTRKIIVCLAVADLFASLGVLTRSCVWLAQSKLFDVDNDQTSIIFCAVSSAWIQYFYTVTWIWTLCYAIDVHRVLRERKACPYVYHTVSWLVPGVLCSIGLSILYIPDADCHKHGENVFLKILPNYCITYIPVVVVMIANPILYFLSSRTVQVAICRNLNQFTSRERYLVDSIKMKFSFIIVVFYVCWLPNLVNGVLLWIFWYDLPKDIILSLWYIMAVTNPLQAMFNCLVYRRWFGSNQISISCFRKGATSSTLCVDYTPEESPSVPSERTPLLESSEYAQQGSRNSINYSPTL